MRAVGVIPARWAASRFEGKILADIAGKPMIQHVWEKAQKSRLLDGVLIACDDTKIEKACAAFGAKVVMTSADHQSGSDRIAEAVADMDVDIVVNIQGDEPLMDPSIIDSLVSELFKDENCSMATVIKQIQNSDEIRDPNVVKVVIDQNRFALYFSRSPIPYNRQEQVIDYFKHLGIYAYRKKFLMAFCDLPKAHLEQIEKLEQLRVLEAGYKIKTILTDVETIGVDTPEDLKKVEDILK